MNESNNFYPNTSMDNESQQSQQTQQQAQQPNANAAQTQNFMSRGAIDNDTNSFDVMVWVMRFVRYWYLFVIGVTVALVIAHYQNRKWQPIYQTKAQVMLDAGKNSGGYGMGTAMNGFNLQAGYRNVNNQIIMFGSHDLIRKVIDKLPFDVNCFIKGKYRNENIYKHEPVTITKSFSSPDARGIVFTISDNNDNTSYTITWTRNEHEYAVKGKYGIPLQTSLFQIKVDLNENYFPKYTFSFNFENKEDLVNSYSSRLSFDFVMKGSSVISVELTGNVAEKDIDFIDMLCETFIQESLDRKNEEASKTIDFINSQLGSIEDSLQVSEGKLKSYRINNQIVDINSYSGQIIADNRVNENKFAEFKLKENYFDYLTNYLKSNVGDDIIALPATLGISDGTLNQFVGKYNELVTKRNEVGEKNPYYAKYTQQINQLKENMLAVTKNMRSSMNIEKRDLQERNNKTYGQISTLPDKESTLSNYQRRFKIQDDYYTFLLQKRAEAQVQKASNSADNIILEKARVTGMTNGDVKGKTKTFYLAVGILLPLIFVLLKVFLNTKIVDKKDVEKYSPYPYFGSIRHTNSKSKIPVQGNPRSGLAESYRVIRTRIEFLVKRQAPTTVLITSTESGDGKTTFALNFAAMYAHTKRKTLLIDLDLRKPSVIDRLNLPNDKRIGISNYLIGQIEDYHDLIITNEKYNFDIISGGSVPPNPGELIRSEALRDLINKFKETYDHIVIDTSPIGLVADAYAMMFNVDTNIFIARSDKTNKTFFESILQQLKSDNVQNVFIVLNDVDEKKVNYSNYHEYGRRSYYMKKDEYHNYTQEYFDEDEEEIEEKNIIKRFVKNLKNIKREYF
ncbi:MAG: polysaccharide biosynthesis tyrosine autokinase [Paludibacteraceae bacterium]|nr:polysaccharide biosynthesis tyrosine autokinase [Paludibacteraceae bacterium]